MKTHWYTSPEPPKFGEDLQAVCGEVVWKAQPMPALWDTEAVDGLVTCRECDRGLVSERYAAVIQGGQESKLADQ